MRVQNQGEIGPGGAGDLLVVEIEVESRAKKIFIGDLSVVATSRNTGNTVFSHPTSPFSFLEDTLDCLDLTACYDAPCNTWSWSECSSGTESSGLVSGRSPIAQGKNRRMRMKCARSLSL